MPPADPQPPVSDPPRDSRFRPESRLHTGRDYGRVFHRQQKAAGRHVVVLVAPKPKAAAGGRLGIMVSTKVAKRAVRRHQLKRWVRELYRLRLRDEAPTSDVVVLFRADPPDHARLDQEILALLAKALAANASPRGSRRPGGQP